MPAPGRGRGVGACADVAVEDNAYHAILACEPGGPSAQRSA
ncbi:unnamed protein product [Mycetohabitans rhizoxinica HKI 454]|uniref:Uncharacterized protein n=1 Tax=Mycetohabitans rhizoxinica (strain DSM 19002 / CIP 109453 / HKI 454) TaxID=882378 RepID=E5ANP3_MYCRK|nr:unnamed protein product [Mycetohabitans rhizoxinica HKI 454]